MNEKIQKVLSRLGYGSRRKIEKIVQSGHVYINSEKISIGQRINQEKIDVIQIYNKFFSLKNIKKKTRVLVYNKPEGEICTKYDIKNRSLVFDKIPFLKNDRWISIGRLDINTRGLLLFTNNGDLACKLMHPKYEIEREYYIRALGDITKKKINMLKYGIQIKNYCAKFKNISISNDYTLKKNKWYKGVLTSGKNRVIRKMFKFCKCEVNRLIRIRYGNIILPKNLKLGHWIELHSTLIDKLYDLIELNKKNLCE